MSEGWAGHPAVRCASDPKGMCWGMAPSHVFHQHSLLAPQSRNKRKEPFPSGNLEKVYYFAFLEKNKHKISW